MTEHARILPPNYEPTAWLREAIDRRTAELASDPQIATAIEAGVFVTALMTDKPSPPGSREDRTCDRCRTYSGPKDHFTTLLVRLPFPGGLSIGLCDACADKEVPTP